MIQTLIDALQRPLLGPDKKVTTIPDGHHVENLQRFDLRPPREMGALRVDDIDSLIDYLTAHGGSKTAAFITKDAIALVLDWHSGEPGWGEHTAYYPLFLTEEWKAWQGINAKPVGQAALAEFLDEWMPSIAEPDAATIYEAVTRLKGSRNIQFESSKRLDNGDMAITWKEETKAGSQAGDGKFPSEMVLELPVIKGSEQITTYRIRTLIRYRIAEGRLTFELKMLRTDNLLDLALAAVDHHWRQCISTSKLLCKTYRGKIYEYPAALLRK